MTEHVTPQIGDPPKEDKPERIRVSREEALRYLSRRRLPVTKRTIRRARKRIRNRKHKQSLPKGRDISFSEPEAPRLIVYGQRRIQPTVTFLNQTNNKKWMNFIASVVGHEIESYDQLYLDGNSVTFGLGSTIAPTDPFWSLSGTKPNGDPIDYDSKVYLATDKMGTDGQAAHAGAITNNPSHITSDHRQRGVANVYGVLVWDAEIFPDGLPEMEMLVSGKKVYDPRTASTAYSANAALCAADILLDSRIGKGESLSRIDTSTDPGGLQWAADICDEAVSLKGGGTEPRYEVNGVWDTETEWEEILADMEVAMAGSVTYSGGKYRFWPGKARTPSITLTMDDLRGAPTIETLISRRDNFNSIRGKFPSADKNYEITDFPAMQLSSAVTADGRETWEDINLNAVTSHSQAQRIAMIELRRVQETLTVTAPFGLKAFQLSFGDTVAVTMDRYEWSSKYFEVQDINFYLDSSGMELITELVLREISSGVYSWTPASDENDFNPSPNSDLPDPWTVEDPTGLTLTSGTTYIEKQSDGTILSHLNVQWTAPADEYVVSGGKIEIQYKTNAGSTWFTAAEVPGDHTEFNIRGLKDGTAYDVRVRSISALRVKGDWVTESNHTLVGKSEAPSDVSVFSATVGTAGITLAWDHISDADRDTYEIRRGTVWATADAVADGIKGTSYVDSYKTSGSVTYLIKAIDTTGNESTNAASDSATPAAPGAVQNLTIDVIDNNVLVDWTAPATGSFNVAYYNVYKGATASAANFLTQATGTFFQYITKTSENTTFWIEPVDEGGNVGTASSKAITTYAPADYVLQETGTLIISDGTLTNAVNSDASDQCFVAPVDTSRTWTQHFTDEGFTTIQDFIDSDYTSWAEPAYTVSPGSYEVEVDLGVLVSGTSITLTWDQEFPGSGEPTITPTISYRADAGDPWTSNEGNSVVYATSVRYMKFKIEVDAGSDDKAVASLCNITYTVRVKKVDDEGSATSSAAGAKTVNFNIDFLDVKSINVTPKNDTAGYKPVVDFDDSPNPTSFDVHIFDDDGNRVAVPFYWKAGGTVNPV